MAMRLKSVVYPTADLARATAFYEALGLPLQFQDGAGWAQFKPEGGTFALGAGAEIPTEDCGPVVTFETTELDALQARLVAAGVAIVATRDMGSHGQTVTIRDPDGNLVHLYQKAR
jgi:catechol 2,3-dioxygenase-like lactoylglutathione lyase family enzyme